MKLSIIIENKYAELPDDDKFQSDGGTYTATLNLINGRALTIIVDNVSELYDLSKPHNVNVVEEYNDLFQLGELHGKGIILDVLRALYTKDPVGVLARYIVWPIYKESLPENLIGYTDFMYRLPVNEYVSITEEMTRAYNWGDSNFLENILIELKKMPLYSLCERAIAAVRDYVLIYGEAA